MTRRRKSNLLFSTYYREWIQLYKMGAVREVTLDKYWNTHQRIIELAPNLRVHEIDRVLYQKLLNDYAETHEKQTTLDFHHLLKGAIRDAIEDGYLLSDPTRKVVIKGKTPREKKIKYLNQFELQALIKQLNLTPSLNWDWFILLIAKTGIRFAEALAITPASFDFFTQKLTISQTWSYKKGNGEFQPTKNHSSIRKIQLDWQIAMQFSQLTQGLPHDKPIFVTKRVFNSTINNRLQKLCLNAKIPVITIHGLRHTHASLLLFAGVSIASVAARLGHSSMSTTQETYLHIIQELENQDNDKIMRHLASLI